MAIQVIAPIKTARKMAATIANVIISASTSRLLELVDRAEAAGLVKRIPDANDHRRQRLILTKQGAARRARSVEWDDKTLPPGLRRAHRLGPGTPVERAEGGDPACWAALVCRSAVA
jgi:hypothetical protein